jgi:nicotinamide-nucleotide amidase
MAGLADAGHTVAVAESLTGGLLVAELVSVPGASRVVLGGVVAYATAIKQTVLGVPEALLGEHGPVHPEVARRMALGVRSALAVGGRDATIGLSTTGVAGPGSQDGHPAGTAFVGIAVGPVVSVLELRLSGDRSAIRRAVVSEALSGLSGMIAARP